MNQKKKWSVAVAAAVCVLMTTVSVGATTHYLNNRDALQEATENADSASIESERIELGSNMSDEYVTYITSGAWKDDIANAELVSTSEAVEKNENGAYEFTYSEESGDTSSQMTMYIMDMEFVGNVAVRKMELTYEPEEGSVHVTIVAEKQEDGTANIKVYK
jgi:hypothetical protein